VSHENGASVIFLITPWNIDWSTNYFWLATSRRNKL